MKRVYSSDDNLIVGHLREVLQANHIPCIVRNEFLLGGAGELPPTECWPEIWILEDFQYEKARALVEATLALDHVQESDWRCGGCGELIEGQFSACWKCGSDRPFPEG